MKLVPAPRYTFQNAGDTADDPQTCRVHQPHVGFDFNGLGAIRSVGAGSSRLVWPEEKQGSAVPENSRIKLLGSLSFWRGQGYFLSSKIGESQANQTLLRRLQQDNK